MLTFTGYVNRWRLYCWWIVWEGNGHRRRNNTAVGLRPQVSNVAFTIWLSYSSCCRRGTKYTQVLSYYNISIHTVRYTSCSRYFLDYFKPRKNGTMQRENGGLHPSKAFHTIITIKMNTCSDPLFDGISIIVTKWAIVWHIFFCRHPRQPGREGSLLSRGPSRPLLKTVHGGPSCNHSPKKKHLDRPFHSPI